MIDLDCCLSFCVQNSEFSKILVRVLHIPNSNDCFMGRWENKAEGMAFKSVLFYMISHELHEYTMEKLRTEYKNCISNCCEVERLEIYCKIKLVKEP